MIIQRKHGRVAPFMRKRKYSKTEEAGRTLNLGRALIRGRITKSISLIGRCQHIPLLIGWRTFEMFSSAVRSGLNGFYVSSCGSYDGQPTPNDGSAPNPHRTMTKKQMMSHRSDCCSPIYLQDVVDEEHNQQPSHDSHFTPHCALVLADSWQPYGSTPDDNSR